MIWTYLGGIGGKELICLCRRLKETLIQSLVWEDPLEKGMTTHFSILAWRIPWTQEPGGLQSTGLQSRISLKWLSRTHAGASLVAQW